MLENTFWLILKMSVIASIAAGVIMIFRWMLGDKLPKIFSYAVWAIVLIRLLIPFSISSNLSIFNIVPSPDIVISERIYPNENGNKSAIDNTINNKNTSKTDNFINELTDSTNPNKNVQSKIYSSNINSNSEGAMYSENTSSSITPENGYVSVIAYIWLAVVLIMLGLSIYAYLKTSKRLKTATLYKNNGLVEECSKMLNLNRIKSVYTSDVIDTPVVVGLIRVRIILPTSFAHKCSQEDLKHMITHEMVHIKRLDYIIKPLAVLALCIHWFNPVMWLSFVLSQKDMEMSCDARVLSVHNRDIRSEYAKSLINIAARQNVLLNGGLLAFGESNIKSRIKDIMRFKKTRVWMGVTVVAVLVVLGFVLLTNGQNDGNGNNIGGAAKGDNNSPKILINEDDLNNLLKHRSKYIGDASNVSNLLNKLPYGDRKNGISLETDSSPYGITVNYNLEDAEKIQDKVHLIEPVLIDNALILFSLIENVETVNFNILSANGYKFQFTRTEMQEYFDKELWAYSNDKRTFEEFLMDISFEILVYPEKYSPAMSIVPGMRIVISLNGAYYNFDFSEKYSTENGILRTMDSGKVSQPSKTINVEHEFVYWSPLDMMGTDKEDTVTISILDKDKNIIIEKQISIIKDGNYYVVKPSHDVLTYNYYDLERN